MDTTAESTLGTGRNTWGGMRNSSPGLPVQGGYHAGQAIGLGSGTRDEPFGNLSLGHHHAPPQTGRLLQELQ